MSDRHGDPDSRLFQRALVGFTAAPSDEPDGYDLFAPGRGWLEASVGLSAFAILIPLCACGAVAAALMARRATCRRWAAALLAGVWCGLLGTVIRLALGFPVAP